MKIYTSYYGRMKYLPKNIIPVSISLSMPKDIHIRKYLALAPSWSILNEYKLTGDKEKYIKRFKSEILNKTSVVDLLIYLQNLATSDSDICLMCYEKSNDFCHRHIVSSWLREFGIPCQEYKF